MEHILWLVVYIFLFGIVFYVLWWFVNAKPLPEPFGTVVQYLIILAAVVCIISILFGWMPLPNLRRP
jgi:hypothetical protein